MDYGDELFWLSVVIQRKYAQVCLGFDLTPAQATLICAVRNGPRQMVALAASLGMTKNALSQLVDRTARRGLVTRAASTQDGRVVLLEVTPVGKELADAVYAEITERLPEIADDLDVEDQRALRRVATAVVDVSDLSPAAARPDRRHERPATPEG